MTNIMVGHIELCPRWRNFSIMVYEYLFLHKINPLRIKFSSDINIATAYMFVITLIYRQKKEKIHTSWFVRQTYTKNHEPVSSRLPSSFSFFYRDIHVIFRAPPNPLVQGLLIKRFRSIFKRSVVRRAFLFLFLRGQGTGKGRGRGRGGLVSCRYERGYVFIRAPQRSSWTISRCSICV